MWPWTFALEYIVCAYWGEWVTFPLKGIKPTTGGQGSIEVCAERLVWWWPDDLTILWSSSCCGNPQAPPRFFERLYLERGEGREKERGRNINVWEIHWLVASHTPPTGDLACNLGICPDWGSNRQPFHSQTGAQSTEPHQPGLDANLVLPFHPVSFSLWALKAYYYHFRNFVSQMMSH